MQIKKICQRDVVTVSPDASLLEAARLMRSEHVGDVVVVDDERHVAGIVTDRDIVVSVLAKDVEHLEKLAVRDVVTAEPVIAEDTEDAEAVLARMKRAGVRRVPVVDARRMLVGMFAIDDFLGLLASDLAAIVALSSNQRKREQAHRP